MSRVASPKGMDWPLSKIIHVDPVFINPSLFIGGGGVLLPKWCLIPPTCHPESDAPLVINWLVDSHGVNIGQHYFLVLGRACGSEPRGSLKGNHKGWFIGGIPSFPAENQQDERTPGFRNVGWRFTASGIRLAFDALDPY